MAMAATSPNVVDQATLIRRVKSGEKSLFYELVRPYENSLYWTAFSILQSGADAEEVVQEALLKALQHLGTLRAEARFQPWLLQIARNEALMRRRKERKHLYDSIDDHEAKEEGSYMPRQFADWREIPSEELERKEVRTALNRALQSIPEMYREVVSLRDMQQLTLGETAGMLGISIPAVKTRLHRARLQLRGELTPIFSSPGTHESFYQRLASVAWHKAIARAGTRDR